MSHFWKKQRSFVQLLSLFFDWMMQKILRPHPFSNDYQKQNFEFRHRNPMSHALSKFRPTFGFQIRLKIFVFRFLLFGVRSYPKWPKVKLNGPPNISMIDKFDLLCHLIFVILRVLIGCK